MEALLRDLGLECYGPLLRGLSVEALACMNEPDL